MMMHDEKNITWPRYNFLQNGGHTVSPPGPLWNPNAPAAEQPPAVTSTTLVGPPPDILSYGPFLRYGGYDPAVHAYYVSILAILHQTLSPKAPILRFRDLAVSG